MTLMATLGMALFSWINNTLTNISRISEHVRRETAMDNALAFIQTINPMEEPKGEMKVGAYQVHWNSKPVAVPRRSKALFLSAPGFYELNLFVVKISVFEEKLLVGEFEVQLTGYRQLERKVQGFE